MSIDFIEYKGYKLSIITLLKDIAEISSNWGKLLQINNSSNIYLDPHYFSTQFNSRSPGYKPFLAFFSKEGEDVGCIIAKSKKKTFPLKFGYLKGNTTEMNVLEIEIDGVLSNKNKSTEEIIANYLQDLITNNVYEAIEFQHFSERNFLWDTLKNQKVFNHCITQPGMELLTILRNCESGELVVSHKSKTLRSFKRFDKILSSKLKNVSVKKYNSVESINDFIRNSEKISKKSYHYNLGIGIENSRYWIDLLTNLAKEGFFSGYILFGNNIPIAYNYGVLHQNIMFGFNMSYNLDYRRLMPGRFLIRRIFEDLLLNSIDIYHFGYGDSEYKKLFSNERNEESSYLIFGNSLKSYCNFKILSISIKINSFVNRTLVRLRIQNKIKKMWRSRIAR